MGVMSYSNSIVPNHSEQRNVRLCVTHSPQRRQKGGWFNLFENTDSEVPQFGFLEWIRVFSVALNTRWSPTNNIDRMILFRSLFFSPFLAICFWLNDVAATARGSFSTCLPSPCINAVCVLCELLVWWCLCNYVNLSALNWTELNWTELNWTEYAVLFLTVGAAFYQHQ